MRIALATSASEELALLRAGGARVVRYDPCPELMAARLAAASLDAGRAMLLDLGDLRINRLARTASRAGRPLGLLPREYLLLLALARRAGHVVSHRTLCETVLGLRFDPGTNVIAVHVSRLRAKLDRGAAPMLITVRGLGYRLDPVPPPIEGTPAPL